MRAATQNELEDPWFVRPDDEIAADDEPVEASDSLHLRLIYSLAVTLALAVSVIANVV
jgi:hypothetical protein